MIEKIFIKDTAYFATLQTGKNETPLDGNMAAFVLIILHLTNESKNFTSEDRLKKLRKNHNK